MYKSDEVPETLDEEVKKEALTKQSDEVSENLETKENAKQSDEVFLNKGKHVTVGKKMNLWKVLVPMEE